MTFPLDYKGQIACDSLLISNIETFQREFIQQARERLEKARASVVVRGDEISFIPSANPITLFNLDGALLSSVPSGKIILNSDEGTISYYLDFRKGLMFLSLAIWVGFGSMFIFGTGGSFVLKIIIIGIVWGLMIVTSGLIGVSRFKEFIKRVLSGMNAREI